MTKKVALYILKILIMLVIFYLLLSHLSLTNLKQTIVNADLLYLILALLLLLPNLIVQYLKLSYLISNEAILDRRRERIWQAVFMGIALALTPGRLGELGKLMGIKELPRFYLFGVALKEKIYDTYALFFFSLLFIPIFPHNFWQKIGLEYNIVLILEGAGVLCLAWLIVRPQILASTWQIIDRLAKRELISFNLIKAFKESSSKSSFNFFWLSSLSYFIYLTQFVLLSVAFCGSFDVKLYPAASFAILIKTLLPLTVGDVGIREGSAAFVYKYFGFSQEGAISAAAFLFLINIILPTILYLLFAFKQKLSKFLLKKKGSSNFN